MENIEIVADLTAIKKQIAELGMKYVENQMPVSLSDVGLTLRPFTSIDSSIDQAIKKLSSGNVGLIPKSSTLKS